VHVTYCQESFQLY